MGRGVGLAGAPRRATGWLLAALGLGHWFSGVLPSIPCDTCVVWGPHMCPSPHGVSLACVLGWGLGGTNSGGARAGRRRRLAPSFLPSVWGHTWPALACPSSWRLGGCSAVCATANGSASQRRRAPAPKARLARALVLTLSACHPAPLRAPLFLPCETTRG